MASLVRDGQTKGTESAYFVATRSAQDTNEYSGL
jgi:hypothetical protein